MSNHSSKNERENPAEKGSLSPKRAHDALQVLHEELNRLKRSIRLAIQNQLASMAGASFGSLAANRKLVSEISVLLESHALRVRCNECGHPAILRVSTRPGCESGVFVFDHTIEGRRTFHGGKTQLPEIRLVAKPPRKKKAG